jgi:hypothetical protein
VQAESETAGISPQDVVSKHFKLLRWRIMRTAAKWLQAAQALPAIYDISVGRW